MKKYFLIALLSCCAVYASVPEKVDTLSSKISWKNTEGYYVFSDDTCWKVFSFSKRWRSISEWWYDVKLVPENYECSPGDWTVGTPIEIYPKDGNLEVDQANASNQEMLRRCTHLFYNSLTGQVLFAYALRPAECIVQLYNDGYATGYQEGVEVGYANGHKSGYQQGHSSGYNEGYNEGYSAGYSSGRSSCSCSCPR